MVRKSKSPPPERSPFERMAEELLKRPEGPAALGFMAKMGRMMQPQTDAINRLVDAIAADLREPSDATAHEVASAKLAYELLTGNEAAGDLWAGFVKDAEELNHKARCQPPAIEEILTDTAPISDMGYAIAGDLGGIKGTWHRLWSSISSERFFAGMGTALESIVPELRAEFEQMLGRAMSEDEWHRLETHAHKHCDEVLTPHMAKIAQKPEAKD